MSEQTAPSTHIIEPVKKHTHTAIFLHGRGDNGPDFAHELLTSRLSSTGGDTSTLSMWFPSWRWIFPSAPSRWSTVFQEELPLWFEAASPLDSTLREDIQMEGIRESVADITRIIDEEVSRLEGHSQNLVLCGISQGAAVGLWALLYQGRPARKLGGFVGASCWLPFSSEVKMYWGPNSNNMQPVAFTFENSGAQRVVDPVLEAVKISLQGPAAENPLLSTPILLGHGTDDAYVDVSLGRKARDVLRGIGFTNVTWKEYIGAQQAGHWFKEPEQLDDIAEFLAAVEAE